MISGNVETLEVVGEVITSADIDATINNNSVDLEPTINPITRVASDDYIRLINKPKINYVELINNKTLDDLDIQVKGDYPDEALTNTDIENILNGFAE